MCLPLLNVLVQYSIFVVCYSQVNILLLTIFLIWNKYQFGARYKIWHFLMPARVYILRRMTYTKNNRRKFLHLHRTSVHLRIAPDTIILASLQYGIHFLK